MKYPQYCVNKFTGNFMCCPEVLMIDPPLISSWFVIYSTGSTAITTVVPSRGSTVIATVVFSMDSDVIPYPVIRIVATPTMIPLISAGVPASMVIKRRHRSPSTASTVNPAGLRILVRQLGTEGKTEMGGFTNRFCKEEVAIHNWNYSNRLGKRSE